MVFRFVAVLRCCTLLFVVLYSIVLSIAVEVSYLFISISCYSLSSYIQNPAYGNAAEVEENLLKQKNSQRMKQWLCEVTSEQVGNMES